MSWLEHHKESERLASDAETASRGNRRDVARELYLRAAQAESRAIEALDHSRPRTLAISAVSAASLYFKAAHYEEAESLAARWLAHSVPSFAKDQLRLVLDAVWAEQVRQQTSVGFAPGQVLVTMRGGEVVRGGAPLDLITSKITAIQSMYYRTAELLTGLPHRRHGQPSKQILDRYRPWLFQTALSNYHFAMAVEGKPPRPIDDPVSPAKITGYFFDILHAGTTDPTGLLTNVVPDPEYRNTFLKLTRNLASPSHAAASIALYAPEHHGHVVLDAFVRDNLTTTIRDLSRMPPRKGTPATFSGTLHAIHLHADSLEVSTRDGQHVQITGIAEQVDDVIHPLINKAVAVHVVSIAGRHRLVDIEPTD